MCEGGLIATKLPTLPGQSKLNLIAPRAFLAEPGTLIEPHSGSIFTLHQEAQVRCSWRSLSRHHQDLLQSLTADPLSLPTPVHDKSAQADFRSVRRIDKCHCANDGS